MKRFSRDEVAYLQRQELGRIATAGADGQPHVTPVTYVFDSESQTIVVPGFDRDSKKYRDLSVNPQAGFVVDDVQSFDPFEARGVCIRGDVELFTVGGEMHSEGIGGAWLRIRPRSVTSWGLKG